MKAIVANLLLGSMFYCLLSNFSVSADSPLQEEKPDSRTLSNARALSAKALKYDNLNFLSPKLDLESQDLIYSLSIGDKEYLKQIINPDNWDSNQDINKLNFLTEQFLPINKKSQIHQGERGDLILGFHDTFWQSNNKQKYWGLTAVKQWGDNKAEELTLKKLNYRDAAPLLPKGTKALNVSGGGKNNFLSNNDVLGEFEDFRGGLAYHEGLGDNLTLGLGFFYEDLLSGFSQLSYQPTNFPISATVSLFTVEEGIDVNTHLQFQPAEEFVLNFHSNSQRQKFDLNWGIASGVTLTAEGNSEEENLKAGAKIAFKNELVSFLAKAELDNNNDLQWRVSSRLGPLQLIHATNIKKSNSEIRYDLADYSSNFQCAIFFKHQTREFKRQPEDLAIWGLNFNSGEKIGKKHYSWEFELGYGMGSQGQGAIASVTKALNSKVFLTLTYEDISLKSDDTKIKLELSSK